MLSLESSTTSLKKQSYDERYFRERYVNAVETLANQWSETLIKCGKYFAFQFSEPDLPLIEMDDWYRNEKIRYFTKKGLEECQVYIINGLVYDKNLHLYTSSLPLNEEAGEGEMIVMDELGNTFITPKKRGKYHHSSILSARPIAYAGLCFATKGNIDVFTYSGHYQPTEREESLFLELFLTHPLVEKPTLGEIKFNPHQGGVITLLTMFQTQTLLELYELVASRTTVNKYFLDLTCNGKRISSASTYTIKEEPLLKNGSIIDAFARCISHHKKYQLMLLKEQDPLLAFPKQAVSRIFYYLNRREIKTCRLVSKTWAKVATEKLNSMPGIDPSYPGIRATFTCVDYRWNTNDFYFDDLYYRYGSSLCGQIKYESKTKDSLVRYFVFYRYRDGTIAISMDFQKNNIIFAEYLLHHAIGEEIYDTLEGYYYSSDHKEIQALFKMISENNTIPKEHYATVKKIVERGSCDKRSNPPKKPKQPRLGRIRI